MIGSLLLNKFVILFAHHQHRARGVAYDAFSRAAKHEMFYAGVSARCNDDQIDTEVARQAADFVKGSAF